VVGGFFPMSPPSRNPARIQPLVCPIAAPTGANTATQRQREYSVRISAICSLDYIIRLTIALSRGAPRVRSRRRLQRNVGQPSRGVELPHVPTGARTFA